MTTSATTSTSTTPAAGSLLAPANFISNAEAGVPTTLAQMAVPVPTTLESAPLILGGSQQTGYMDTSEAEHVAASQCDRKCIICARSSVTSDMLKLPLHIFTKIISPVSPCPKTRFVANFPVTLISAVILSAIWLPLAFSNLYLSVLI